MGIQRCLSGLLGIVVVCSLGACFVQEAGDRSARAVAESREAKARAEVARLMPEDVLKLPEMAQAFPGMATALGDACWYLPYAVINEDQGVALVASLTALVLAGKPFPERLDVPPGRGANGSELLYPLHEGVGRFYYADINDHDGPAATGSKIPVAISQPLPGAEDADVLFLDGHLEAVPMGQFPLSAGFLDALSTIDPPEHAE